MTNKFKVGDWCFSNFELHQIKEMKDGRVTSVTDSIMERSGYDLTYSCFPLDLKIKRFSDNVYYWYNELHKIKKPNLNFPDIVRRLEREWIEMCKNKDDPDKVEKIYDRVQKFARDIISQATDLQDIEVDGIKLIRP